MLKGISATRKFIKGLSWLLLSATITLLVMMMVSGMVLVNGSTCGAVIVGALVGMKKIAVVVME